MSSMIYPSRREPVCGVAHRVRSRTQKVREYVHSCLMDFRRDEFDGSQNFELSFPKWLEVLILEKKVSLRGYSRPTADEGIQDVLTSRRVESLPQNFNACFLRNVCVALFWCLGKLLARSHLRFLFRITQRVSPCRRMNFHLGMRMPPGQRFAVSSAMRSADLQLLMRVRGMRRDCTTR